MHSLVEMDVVFLMLTFSVGHELCAEGLTVLKNRKTETINLTPIDKWYHAGLACQILDVNAIPPELEKYESF